MDWSHSEQASAEVKDILGPLMQASISYEEGDIDIKGLRQEVAHIIGQVSRTGMPTSSGKLPSISAR